MTDRIVLKINVELGDRKLTVAALSQILQEALEDRIKQGVFAVDDEIESWVVTASDDTEAQIAAIAENVTWDERCIAEAIDHFGFTDPIVILEHVEAAQTDLDYLQSQDEILEGIIMSSRVVLGVSAVTREDQILTALLERGIQPSSDTDAPRPDL